MASDRNIRLSFLHFPGETRNQIYHHLYEPLDENDAGDEITPAQDAPEWKHFPPLMRTCRQIHQEAKPLLYAPTYIFNESELESNLHFLSSSPAASNLRNVRIEYEAAPFYPYIGPPHDGMWLDLSMLRALIASAPNLERLDIVFSQEYIVHIFHRDLDSPPFYIKGYAWPDMPMPNGGPLPFITNVWQYPKVFSGDLVVDNLVGFVKGVLSDATGEKRMGEVERALRTSRTYRMRVWEKLVLFEDYMKGFGEGMVDVLRGFRGSGSFREVRMSGTVDVKWMRAMAVAAGVTLEAMHATSKVVAGLIRGSKKIPEPS
ncbi:hypothetical protein B0T14DRAFT_569146 [Immersiella caudata]|uniref:Uncharacterized protein n=1 Tax=Immersiella caudata TaxID=314043 RepID=A0AA40BXX6_9PEZI|nr:hypothetical protein B0T14DRAFT_569146 [Immersiella caudata]